VLKSRAKGVLFAALNAPFAAIIKLLNFINAKSAVVYSGFVDPAGEISCDEIV